MKKYQPLSLFELAVERIYFWAYDLWDASNLSKIDSNKLKKLAFYIDYLPDAAFINKYLDKFHGRVYSTYSKDDLRRKIWIVINTVQFYLNQIQAAQNIAAFNDKMTKHKADALVRALVNNNDRFTKYKIQQLQLKEEKPEQNWQFHLDEQYLFHSIISLLSSEVTKNDQMPMQKHKNKKTVKKARLDDTTLDDTPLDYINNEERLIEFKDALKLYIERYIDKTKQCVQEIITAFLSKIPTIEIATVREFSALKASKDFIACLDRSLDTWSNEQSKQNEHFRKFVGRPIYRNLKYTGQSIEVFNSVELGAIFIGCIFDFVVIKKALRHVTFNKCSVRGVYFEGNMINVEFNDCNLSFSDFSKVALHNINSDKINNKISINNCITDKVLFSSLNSDKEFQRIFENGIDIAAPIKYETFDECRTISLSSFNIRSPIFTLFRPFIIPPMIRVIKNQVLSKLQIDLSLLNGITFQDCEFIESHFITTEQATDIIFINCNLSYAKFNETRCSHMTFEGCGLYKIKFIGSFTDSVFENVDCIDADLQINLENVKLINMDFTDSIISKSTFTSVEHAACNFNFRAVINSNRIPYHEVLIRNTLELPYIDLIKSGNTFNEDSLFNVFRDRKQLYGYNLSMNTRDELFYALGKCTAKLGSKRKQFQNITPCICGIPLDLSTLQCIRDFISTIRCKFEVTFEEIIFAKDFIKKSQNPGSENRIDISNMNFQYVNFSDIHMQNLQMKDIKFYKCLFNKSDMLFMLEFVQTGQISLLNCSQTAEGRECAPPLADNSAGFFHHQTVPQTGDSSGTEKIESMDMEIPGDDINNILDDEELMKFFNDDSDFGPCQGP